MKEETTPTTEVKPEYVSIGSGRTITPKYSEIVINLDDIPQELIKTSAKGRRYVVAVLGERKERGKYSETHYLSIRK